MSAPVSSKRLNPRRREILDATLRVIGESGVNGVTHRAVAQEASVALASTTYYFDSKDALVEEALEQMIVRSIEDVRRYTACSGPITQGELIERIVGFADAQINDPLAFLTAQYELMLEAGRRDHLRPLARRWTIAYMDGFSHLVESAGLPEPVADRRDDHELRRGGAAEPRHDARRRLSRGALPATADRLRRSLRLRPANDG